MTSLSDRDRFNPQDMEVETVLGSSLAPLTSVLMSFTGPTDPVVPPCWFDRDGKKPSVKTDLAIYSYVFGVSGQCKSLYIVFLDLTSCVI